MSRCECMDRDCPHGSHWGGGAMDRCANEAVRTAVVGGGIWNGPDWHDVPMCEQCAEHAEQRTEDAR